MIKKNIQNKFNSIMKKMILYLNEKKQKRSYFTKWKELLCLGKALFVPYLKKKLSYLNDEQTPISSKSEKRIDNLKLSEPKKNFSIDFNDNKAITNEDKSENNNNNNRGETIKEKIKEIIIINTDIRNPDKNNEEESSVISGAKRKFSPKDDNEEEEEEDKGEMEEEEEDEEIMSFNNDKKNNKDLDKKIKSLKIKNRLYNILEKINNKKKLYNYFNHWHNFVIAIKKKEKKKNDDISSRKIISDIIKHFSPDISSNSKKKYKKFHKRKNSSNTENALNFRTKKKRIIVKNELTDRKRSKTLLPHQVGNIGVNTDDSINDNDYDFISGDILFNNLKHSATHIKFFNTKLADSKSEDSELYNYNKVNNLKPVQIKDNNKTKQTIIEKEKDKNLIKDICDISQKNINLLNKNINITKNNSNINLGNNEFKDKYISLLKKNYKTMAGYQIFYLYSLFNERVDYFKLKYAFNKLKKKK